MEDLDISAEKITELRLLERGDHLAVLSNTKGLQYYHHGIFLGSSIGVAEFSGDSKTNARVRIVDFLDFKGERDLIRFVYKPTQCVPPEECARTAEHIAADPSMYKAYDLLKNNCEHFATRCKIGRAVSHQVLEKIRALRPAILALATGVSPSISAGFLAGGISCRAAKYSNTKK